MAERDQILQEWQRNIGAHGRANSAVSAATAGVITQAWGALPGPYDPAANSRFTAAAAAAVTRGRSGRSSLMTGFLQRLFGSLGAKFPRVSPVPISEPRGMPITAEFGRPLEQWRYEQSKGVPENEARDHGLNRALLIADADLSMAGRDAAYDVFVEADIVGYRRILHPELSTSPGRPPGPVCGLCIAAATRIYKKRDLLPLHARCRCTVAPVFQGREDWAQIINGIDLEGLYVRLGETQRNKLIRIRVTVEDHGELGPQLRNADHHFRGSDDLVA